MEQSKGAGNEKEKKDKKRLVDLERASDLLIDFIPAETKKKKKKKLNREEIILNRFLIENSRTKL